MSTTKSLADSLTRSRTKKSPLVYGATPQVNLLPPAERSRRERTELTRRWGTIAIAAIVLVVLAVLAAELFARSAKDDLEEEQARTRHLAGEVASYQDVSAAASDKGSYEAYRTQAMASDVTWKSVLGALQAALPAGASVTGFEAAVGDGADTGADTGASSAGSTGTGIVTPTAPHGTALTVTVQVTSMQSVAQKAMVASFRRVPGVLEVDLGSLTSSSSVSYSSTTTVFFDDSVLSHKYVEAAR